MNSVNKIITSNSSTNVREENSNLTQIKKDSTSNPKLMMSGQSVNQTQTVTSAQENRKSMDNDHGLRRVDSMPSQSSSQQYYQNVQQLIDDQSSNIDPSGHSRRSFNAKRDFFERLNSAPTAYDSPPKSSPKQKLVTTITTSSNKTSSDRWDNRSSITAGSPTTSADHLVQQVDEVHLINSSPKVKTQESPSNINTERSERSKNSLDVNNREVARTKNEPSGTVAQTLKNDHNKEYDPMNKTAKVDQPVDDHEAIQKLTRALQDHGTQRNNEFSRVPLPSSSILVNTTTTTTTTTTTAAIPAHSHDSNTNKNSTQDQLRVIDALLDDPIVTGDEKQSAKLQKRLRSIVLNLKNADYLNFLRQSTKNKNEDASNDSNNLDEQSLLLTKKESAKKKGRSKSKQTTRPFVDYNVLDALLASPLSPPLTPVFAQKYKHFFPRSSSTDYAVVKKKDKNISSMNNSNSVEKNCKLNSQESEVFQSSPSFESLPQNRSESLTRTKSTGDTNTTGTVSPRIVYRYLDEHGHVLKISSVPPYQLKEVDPTSIPDQLKKDQQMVLTRKGNQSSNFNDDNQQALYGTPTKPSRNSIKATVKEAFSREFAPGENRFPSSPNMSVPNGSRQNPVVYESAHSGSVVKPLKYHTNKQSWPHLGHHGDFHCTARPMMATYDTDSSISEPFALERPNGYGSRHSLHRYQPAAISRSMQYDNAFGSGKNDSNGHRSFYKSTSRGISPEYSTPPMSRNYIEIFRDGDTKPTEIYSLPFDDVAFLRQDSRYDQSPQEKQRFSSDYSSTLKSRNEPAIFHAAHSYVRPAQSSNLAQSPDCDSIQLDNCNRNSKSLDYRPLRNKIQRECNFNSYLLVDESDSTPSSTKTYENQTSRSSPEELFTFPRNRAKLIAI